MTWNLRSMRRCPLLLTHRDSSWVGIVLTAGGPAGVQQIDAAWDGVVQQLASLDDMGMEFVEKPSWKSASGFAQQARCYALLAVLDLAFSSQLQLLTDADGVEAAGMRLDHLLTAREKLLYWLHGASRPRALTGAPRLSGRVTASNGTSARRH